MLYIYGVKFTPADKQTLKMILGHANIPEEAIRFVDLESEDPDIENRKCILTIGSAIRPVSRALVATGLFKASQLIGNNIYDSVDKFFMYNIGMSVNDMMSNQENKEYVWEMIVEMAGRYLEWFPFNDSLECINANTTPEVKEVVEPEVLNPKHDNEIVPHLMPEFEDATTDAVEVEDSPAQIVDPNNNVNNLTFDPNEVLDKLVSHVSTVDPALGKSISRYEKFRIETEYGNINVYPTMRMDDSDELNITFKDLIALLKMTSLLNATKVTFEHKNGTNITN